MLHCCSGKRDCEVYKLKPDEKFWYKRIEFLECCPICENTILQLTKIDNENNVSTYRLKNKKARKFLEKCKKDILFKEDKNIYFYQKSKGKFYLNYNEYGKKKKCYSNLSRMKLGLFKNED